MRRGVIGRGVMWRALGVALLLLAAGPVQAQDVAQIVGAVLLFVPGFQAFGAALLFASNVYGTIEARRNMRRLEEQKRAAYNAGLQDRSINALGTVPPWQIIYGRVVTGGDIVAIFTTDKTATRSDGTTYVRPDAYKHLVIVYAAHQVQAFNDFYIDGVSVGALDVNGWVTGGELTTTDGQTRYREIVLASGGSTTQPDVVTVLSCKLSDSNYIGGENGTVPADGTYTITGAGKTINNTSGATVYVQFTLPVANVPSLRITPHLGTDTQTVDTYLNGLTLTPAQWTAEHRLRGLAYCTVTLDLDNPRFQGGPPNLTADISGKLLFDTRSSTTVYSANPALVARDFLVNAWGADALAADVDTTYCNAAANACDVLNTVTTNSAADGTRWDYNATADGWTGANGTLTWVTGGTVSMTSSTSNPILRSPAALSIAGATFTKVRARIRRTAGAGWTGTCEYVTGGHGESASFRKTIADPGLVNGTWVEVTFDMAALTVGGTDWTTSTITQIRLDLGSTTADVFELDWVSVSKQVPLYTCNGVFRSDQSRESTLADIAESMAGFVYHGGAWLINAGAWTATVMDLTDDDLDGQIEVVQGDAGMEEAFNSVRGTYIAALKASPTDFDPYVQATFVTADGQNLWSDLALPFSDDRWRCKQICRVKTEQARNGQVITYPAKLKAWPLRVGDRVRISSTEYGWALKEFRVTDWQFNIGTSVLLTLQEDAAAAYDLIDAATADPTPNTGLANPWVVAALAGLAAASGTAELARKVDGSIVERARVSWTLVTDAYVASSGGRIEIQWRRIMRDPVNVWHSLVVAGGETQAYIDECVAGDMLVIQARAVNHINAFGPWSAIVHVVAGKTAAPSNVASFTAVNDADGSVVFAWTTPTDIDYFETEIHEEGSWTNGGPVIYRGSANRFVLVRPAPGAHTYQIKHRDTTGNLSTTAASATLTVPGKAQANLVDASGWVFGSATVAGWTAANTSATGSNNVVGSAAPDLATRALWRATSGTAASGSEGGFETPNFPVDPNSAYRYSAWVRLSNNNTGVLYFGPRDAVAAVTTGTPDGQPYFVNALARATLVPLRWYLLVGFVQPSNFGTTQFNQGGIYDSLTGERVVALQDYKWISAPVQTRLRVYQFDTASSAGQITDWWAPAVYLCDGSEPSLPQLMAQVLRIGGGNLLKNSSFTADLDANGLPDDWTAYSTGTTGTITRSIVAGGVAGSTCLNVATTNLGTAVTDRAGVSQVVELNGLAGKSCLFSAWVLNGTGTADVRLFIEFYNAAGGSGTNLGNLDLVVDSPPSSWQRFAAGPKTIPAGTLSCIVYIWTTTRTSAAGAAAMAFDAVQFEIGDLITDYSPNAAEILSLSVGSTQLADAAATEVVTVTAASVNCWAANGTTFTSIATANFGPYAVACQIECSFACTVTTTPDADFVGPPQTSYKCFIDGSAGTDSAEVSAQTLGNGAGKWNINALHTFTLAANTSGSAIAKIMATSSNDGDANPNSGTGVATNAILRATAVKR